MKIFYICIINYHSMNLNEIRERAQKNGCDLLAHLLSNPQYVEMSKIMACSNNNVPARINGKILKIVHYDYYVNPFSSQNEIQFSFDTEEWSGSYDTIMDIDITVLNINI